MFPWTHAGVLIATATRHFVRCSQLTLGPLDCSMWTPSQQGPGLACPGHLSTVVATSKWHECASHHGG